MMIKIIVILNLITVKNQFDKITKIISNVKTKKIGHPI